MIILIHELHFRFPSYQTPLSVGVSNREFFPREIDDLEVKTYVTEIEDVSNNNSLEEAYSRIISFNPEQE